MKEMFQIGFKISQERTAQCMSQKQLAEKAKITQQQLSKIENGDNCNVVTLLKVCKALKFRMVLEKMDSIFPHSWDMPETYNDDHADDLQSIKNLVG